MAIGNRCERCETMEKLLRKLYGEVTRAMDGAGPLQAKLDRESAVAVLGMLDGLIFVSGMAVRGLIGSRGERHGNGTKTGVST